MTKQTVEGFIRMILAMFGGGSIVGGWLTEQLLAEIIGAVAVLVVAAWQFWVTTRKNMIVVVNSMDPVSGVVMKPTPEGVALANQIPSRTVAVAGTVDAAVVADTRK